MRLSYHSPYDEAHDGTGSVEIEHPLSFLDNGDGDSLPTQHCDGEHCSVDSGEVDGGHVRLLIVRWGVRSRGER